MTDSLQFGDVLIKQSKQLEFQIANAGCASLTVDSIVSSNPERFLLLPRSLTFPMSIKGGTTANVAVTFTPSSVAQSVESIEIGTNAGHTFIELEGQGITIVDSVDEENANQMELNIFPNPASSMLSVRGVDENASYEITDLLGRTVLRGTMEGGTISIVALPEGMYVLRCAGQAVRVIISAK